MSEDHIAADAKGVSLPRPAGRKWVFRLLALTLIPVLVLGAAELILRAAGFGHPAGFVLRREVAGEGSWVNNPFFTWKYFSADRAREATPFKVPVDEPDDIFRVMVIGGSTAQGDPDPSYSISRILELMLAARHPRARLQVINAGITAVNSWVAYDVMRTSEALDVDVYVVLTGNNEVVGPYGAASDRAALAGRPGLVRLRLAAEQLRLVQAVGAATSAGSGVRRDAQWLGMEAFVDRRVAEGEPALLETYDAFRRNLEGMRDIAVARGAGFVLCTVPVNLLDCAPFASAVSGALGDDDRRRWQSAYDAGIEHEAKDELDLALTRYGEAAAIDEGHAELMFRMGRCRMGLGQKASAAGFFHRARDLDQLRFRADTTTNRVIREVAAAADNELVSLIDLADGLAQASGAGVPGDEFFYEHVHFNFPGSWLVARLLLPEMERLMPPAQSDGGTGSAPPSPEDCAAALVFSVWDRHRIAVELRGRLQRPPFVDQLDNSADVRAAELWVEALESELSQRGLGSVVNEYREAIGRSTRDWILHYNAAAVFLDGAADGEAAEPHLRFVVQQCPTFGLGHGKLGVALMLQGDNEAAVASFEQALVYRPSSLPLLMNLGIARERQNRPEDAVAVFEKVLDVDPDQTTALFHLGLALNAMADSDRGTADRAESAFKRVLELDPEHEGAAVELERLAAARE